MLKLISHVIFLHGMMSCNEEARAAVGAITLAAWAAPSHHNAHKPQDAGLESKLASL